MRNRQRRPSARAATLRFNLLMEELICRLPPQPPAEFAEGPGEPFATVIVQPLDRRMRYTLTTPNGQEFDVVVSDQPTRLPGLQLQISGDVKPHYLSVQPARQIVTAPPADYNEILQLLASDVDCLP